MHLWTDLTQVPTDWPASVVTIGVFDGVHQGHRELIRAAVDEAARNALPCVVMTFDPNPAEVVGHGDPPARLATLEHRVRLLSELGVDAIVEVPFTKELAQWSPERFASELLRDRFHAATVVVGENFRFGHKAHGDVELLTELGQELGFVVDSVHLLAVDGEGDPVSSTAIRNSLADGDVASAARGLVRPHRVEGVVVRGDGRGHQLGFPTANIQTTPYAAIPADGVYAGRMVLDAYGDTRQTLPAAISIGTNPTFDGVERRIEAFAYDAGDIDLYDKAIAVDFVAKIRDQQKFNDEQELITAVSQDITAARSILGG